MATIDILIGDEYRALTLINVPLDSGQLSQRLFYGFPEFVEWMENVLPNLKQGRLRAALTPQEQLDSILYKWISGKQFTSSRMINDLGPQAQEVWEMKTADLRVFGWIYRPCVFIAVFGDYTDDYKHPTKKKSYDLARSRVVDARNRLNLDEPKYAAGDFNALVSV